jgi:hypothetical protein
MLQLQEVQKSVMKQEKYIEWFVFSEKESRL